MLLFFKLSYIIKELHLSRCGEMADAQDLKSWGPNRPCRFDPDHRHHGTIAKW